MASKRKQAEGKISISIQPTACYCTGSDCSCPTEGLQPCSGKGDQKCRQGTPVPPPTRLPQGRGQAPRGDQESVPALPKPVDIPMLGRGGPTRPPWAQTQAGGQGPSQCRAIQALAIRGAGGHFPFTGNFYKKNPSSLFCTNTRSRLYS